MSHRKYPANFQILHQVADSATITTLEDYLCFRFLYSPGPIFLGTYVPKVLCSQVPIFPRSYVPRDLCSQGHMFPLSYVLKVLYSRALCSPGSSVPQVPCYQSLVFPWSYIPISYVLSSYASRVQSSTSSMFPGPYVSKLNNLLKHMSLLLNLGREN